MCGAQGAPIARRRSVRSAQNRQSEEVEKEDQAARLVVDTPRGLPFAKIPLRLGSRSLRHLSNVEATVLTPFRVTRTLSTLLTLYLDGIEVALRRGSSPQLECLLLLLLLDFAPSVVPATRNASGGRIRGLGGRRVEALKLSVVIARVMILRIVISDDPLVGSVKGRIVDKSSVERNAATMVRALRSTHAYVPVRGCRSCSWTATRSYPGPGTPQR